MNNGTRKRNIFDLDENDGPQEEQELQPLDEGEMLDQQVQMGMDDAKVSSGQQEPLDEGDESKPVVYERDRLVMDGFIQQVLFFRQKIELTDLYELLCVLYNVDKCHRIFKTPEELLKVIQERCATIIRVERDGQGQIMLHWQDVDGSAGKGMKSELISIGKNICSRGPGKE